MNELHELIRQQASYSTLAAWIQKQEKCSYMDACIKLNNVLKQYRSEEAQKFTASTKHPNFAQTVDKKNSSTQQQTF